MQIVVKRKFAAKSENFLAVSSMFQPIFFFFFFFLGLTPCKAEQPLRGMELQEKKAQKRLQDT